MYSSYTLGRLLEKVYLRWEVVECSHPPLGPNLEFLFKIKQLRFGHCSYKILVKCRCRIVIEELNEIECRITAGFGCFFGFTIMLCKTYTTIKQLI